MIPSLWLYQLSFMFYSPENRAYWFLLKTPRKHPNCCSLHYQQFHSTFLYKKSQYKIVLFFPFTFQYYRSQSFSSTLVCSHFSVLLFSVIFQYCSFSVLKNDWKLQYWKMTENKSTENWLQTKVLENDWER